MICVSEGTPQESRAGGWSEGVLTSMLLGPSRSPAYLSRLVGMRWTLVVAQLFNIDLAMICLLGVSFPRCLPDSSGVSTIWIALLTKWPSLHHCVNHLQLVTQIDFSEPDQVCICQPNYQNPESYSETRKFKLYLSKLMSEMQLSLQILSDIIKE